MLSLTVLFTSLLVGVATAQSNSTFNSGSVDTTTKNQWCTSEQNICPLLCGGKSSTMKNQCTGSSLSYTCQCANGSGPANIDQYVGSIPNYVCEATFAQCRQANPGSDSCKTCGTLKPTDVQVAATSTSSAVSSSTDSASAASGTSSLSKAAAPTAAARMDGAIGIGGMAVLGALLL